jgi:transposase
MSNIKVMHKVNKDQLSDLYLTQMKSTRQIAELYACDKSTIIKLLKKYQIPLRYKGGGGKKHILIIEVDGKEVQGKQCTSCGIIKSLFEYNVGVKSSGGRQPKCIECRKLYYEENKESILTRVQLHYYKNRDSILLLRKLNYYANHKVILASRK